LSEVHQVPHQELPFPWPVARLPHVFVPPLVPLLRRQQVSQRQRHLPLQHLGPLLARLNPLLRGVKIDWLPQQLAGRLPRQHGLTAVHQKVGRIAPNTAWLLMQ
jgi:hypothetical protein